MTFKKKIQQQLPEKVLYSDPLIWLSFFGTGSLTNLLQKAVVNTIDQADCQQSYGNVLTPNMMCAGFMEGGRDTCLVRCRRVCYVTQVPFTQSGNGPDIWLVQSWQCVRGKIVDKDYTSEQRHWQSLPWLRFYSGWLTGSEQCKFCHFSFELSRTSVWKK